MGYRALSAYIYCRKGVTHWTSFQARRFSAMVLMLMIEQGVEMGRPSHIHFHIDIEEPKIARARIGGQTVKIASGMLDLRFSRIAQASGIRTIGRVFSQTRVDKPPDPFYTSRHDLMTGHAGA